MRNTVKIFTLLITLLIFIACSKNDDNGSMGPEKFNLFVVEVNLPEGSGADLTGSFENAQAEQQKKLDYLDEVGHLGIEIEPVFNLT